MSVKEGFLSKVIQQQVTARGVTPSKPQLDRQAGNKCDRECLSSNENISLSLLEARAKI